MLMLLRALHPLATQRGEGLCPELIPTMKRPLSRTSIEQATGAPKEGKESVASEDASPPLPTDVSSLPHKR